MNIFSCSNEKIFFQRYLHKDKNPNCTEELIYCLLSNIETTFVFVYDHRVNTVWISPPLGRDRFFKAIFFVLSIQLKQFYAETYDWLQHLKEEVSNRPPKPISESTGPQIVAKKRPRSSKTNYALRDIQSELSKHHKFSVEVLYYSWQNKRSIIGQGRTSFVCKVNVGENSYAVKLVDVYKPAKDALEELENEFNVLKELDGK